MLFTFTFPHLSIFISRGPNFFASSIFTIILEDLAVILSRPINTAVEELTIFFSFTFILL